MVQTKALSGQATPLVQRREDGKKLLQTQETGISPSEITPDLENNINAIRGGGQPLPKSVRAFFESRFGYDFSQVHVHTDVKAAESAHAVNALAYTVGRDVVFCAGQYAPHTGEGQKLLAHELAHVMQQGGGRIVGTNDPGRLSLKPLSLQRTAKFVKGSVSEEFNLAEQVATGRAAGNTDFVLNGTPFTSGTNLATERQALNTPSIGSATRQKGGVECWFDSVPDNEVSYEMKVLKSGAWSFFTTKANMSALFPALNACQTAVAGNATFVVKGMRTNEEQRKRTRTHEDHHVADYKTIFNNVLVPWDKRVTEAQKKHQTMLGTDVNDCEKKLYNASVGQKQVPDDIVAEIIKNINAKATTFHASPAGRNVNISNVQSDKDCNTVTAEAR